LISPFTKLVAGESTKLAAIGIVQQQRAAEKVENESADW
jgi:hypothetical protein